MTRSTDEGGTTRRAAEPGGPLPAFRVLRISDMDPNPFQPRRTFDPEALQRLADSFKTTGMMQPILARKGGAERFEILAGERRWRAAKLAGLLEVPVLLREVTDQQAAEMALIENEHREAVPKLETARAAAALMEREGLKHEDLAAILGMERSSVSNLLRLLDLDQSVQELVGDGPGQLSVGHAKLLVGLHRTLQRSFAKRALEKEMTVRALARVIQREKHKTRLARLGVTVDDQGEVSALEHRLTEHLGQRVKIESPSRRGGRHKAGSLTISYNSFDELDGIFERLGFKPNEEF